MRAGKRAWERVAGRASGQAGGRMASGRGAEAGCTTVVGDVGTKEAGTATAMVTTTMMATMRELAVVDVWWWPRVHGGVSEFHLQELGQ